MSSKLWPATAVDATAGDATAGDPRALVAGGPVLDRLRTVATRAPQRWLAVTTLAAISLYLLTLRGVQLDRMDDLGLVSVLPVTAFVLLGVLGLAFAGTLWLAEEHPRLLLLQVVALVVALQGGVALLEQEPRFATAWVHAGFVEYIGRTGSTLAGADARFSWPGFFALAAFVGAVAGHTGMLGAMRWASTVTNLAYLLPLLVIGRSVLAGWRARWLMLWLFVAANWVGQDYFSPQGFTYLLYLTILALCLAFFAQAAATGRRPHDLLGALQALGVRIAARPARLLARRLGRTAGGRHQPRPAWPAQVAPAPGQGAGLLLAILVLFAAATMTHQLTPPTMVAATGLLVAFGQLRLRGLPVLMFVGLILWFNFMAVPYWSGHLFDVIGGFGRLGANVQTNVAGRLPPVDSIQRRVVLYGRLLFTAAVWALAAVGFLRRLRRGHADWAIALLFLAPFSILAAQSYGGEGLLRTYFFCLPFAALLGAFACFPDAGPRRSAAALAAAAVAATLLPAGMLLVRYGNERFERFPATEVAAMRYIYEQLPPRTTIVTLTANFPGPYRDIEHHLQVTALDEYPELTTADLADIMDRGDGRAALLVTRSQGVNAEAFRDKPPGWLDSLRRRLERSRDFKVVFANPDAQVFMLAAPKATQPPPAGGI